MQKTPTKILKVGRPYDLGLLYDDARLLGFEVAAVETNMHGVRLNLVSSPPFASDVQLDTQDDAGTIAG